MPDPRCCEECFDDDVLKAYINKNGSVGKCSFGHGQQRATIPANGLKELFLPLIRQYEVTTAGEHYDPHESDAFSSGDYLHDAIQNDWQVFSDDTYSLGRAEDLLDAILEPDPREPEDIDLSSFYTSKDRSYTAYSTDEMWWQFEQHIMRERRFMVDPKASSYIVDPRLMLTRERLRLLRRKLPLGRTLYRARIGAEEGDFGIRPLPAGQMGAPPHDKITRGGRVNPPGIRVLYAALDKLTAVAEIRPWVGAQVTVAELVLKRPARLVDLSNPKRLLINSPFGHTDLDEEIERVQTLRLIGKKLSEPVSDETSQIDYVPTQYVAEVIQAQGYDGVMYRSALARGRNVALFDPNHASVQNPSLVRVKRVRYTISPE